MERETTHDAIMLTVMVPCEATMAGARHETALNAIMAGAGHEITRGTIMAATNIQDEPGSNGVAGGLMRYDTMFQALGCGLDRNEVDTLKDDT